MTENEHLEKAKNITLHCIKDTTCKVFLFGSRAMRTHHPKSDIDIGIWGKNRLDSQTKLDLVEQMDNSNIPYKVDMVDFFLVSNEFKKTSPLNNCCLVVKTSF